MWHEVDPNDFGQLQQAVAVLKEHNPLWTSAQQLHEWLDARDVRLFHYQSADYELLVGFEHLSGDAWRLSIGGGSGLLDEQAGRRMSDKIVEFLRAGNLSGIEMYTPARLPSDPDRIILDVGAELLRQHAEVAEVSSRPYRLGRRYAVVLR